MSSSLPHRDAGVRGCSLLEVLVATSVIVVAVAALAQLFAVAIHANARARSTTISVLIAQQKMEELVAAFSAQETSGAIPGASPAGALDRDTPGYCDAVEQNGATYLRRWSIDPLPTSPDTARVLQVLVTRSRGAADAAIDVTRRPDTARLITVRTRRSS